MMVNYSMACGRPVIAFPVGIAQDLIVHKETGWMAEMRNTEDFAMGLDYFYQMDSISFSLIEENCKRHIKECHEIHVDNFIRIFDEPVNV